MNMPINALYNYRKIAEYFSEKTGKHCEFVQDKETMFLKIDGKLFKKERLIKGDKEMNVKKIIGVFEKNL